MPSRDDERLVMRCQLGEPGAIDAFVVRWHGDLRRYVRSWLTSNDEAGDVLQNVWLNVLRGLPGLRNPAAVAPWLFRIARATVMSRLRHRYTDGAPRLRPRSQRRTLCRWRDSSLSGPRIRVMKTCPE